MGSGLREQLKGVAGTLAKARAERAARERAQRVRAENARREAGLFADATRDVVPLPASGRAPRTPAPVPPLPVMRLRDERAALAASLSDGVDADSLLDTDDALHWLRAGVAPNTLRKLRRGDWSVQAHLDLHGMTRDAARDAVAGFLRDTAKKGLRCVRIVHGKGLGSAGREPVLKAKVRRWLMQSDAVLAYVQARGQDGGAGAVLVLLDAGRT